MQKTVPRVDFSIEVDLWQYTGNPYGEGDESQLIGLKTHIGGYFFDAFLRLDHTSKLRMTDHPMEEGGNITDHSFVEPRELSVEIDMSDACVSYVNGQFNQRYTRSVSAYGTLEQLQAERIPLMVYARLKTYDNMLIETITVADDFNTLYGLRATVGLREIIVVKTSTVTMLNRSSAEPHKTGTTNTGSIQPVSQNTAASGGNNENRSTLRQAASFLTGG